MFEFVPSGEDLAVSTSDGPEGPMPLIVDEEVWFFAYPTVYDDRHVPVADLAARALPGRDAHAVGALLASAPELAAVCRRAERYLAGLRGADPAREALMRDLRHVLLRSGGRHGG